MLLCSRAFTLRGVLGILRGFEPTFFTEITKRRDISMIDGVLFAPSHVEQRSEEFPTLCIQPITQSPQPSNRTDELLAYLFFLPT